MHHLLRFLLLGIALLPLQTTLANEFTDVSSSHIYANAIEYLHDEGIVEGYADGTFKPDSTINRVELLKIALSSHALAFACTERYFEFHDTQSGAWYDTYIQTAANCGIVSGYDDGSFRPDNTINYAEAAKIISIIFELEYNDTGDIWYEKYISAISNNNATPSIIIRPANELTRGQMAQMIFSLKVNSVVTAIDLDAYIQAFDEMYSSITIVWSDASWTIKSNGLPSHETGSFPNSGNPNTISEQDETYTITRYPVKTEIPTAVQVPGIAFNGVFYEPGTAETWQNDPTSGWNYEALQDTINLGLDDNNAHVQPTGAYHYHGIPTLFVEEQAQVSGSDLVMVGLASDGFPMYVSINKSHTPSYQLKTGTRPDGPGGSYDGTFTQDFTFQEGSGTLDQCNGTTITTKEYPDSTYAYLITETFPYITRCVYGTPDPSFKKGPGGGRPPRR